MDTAHFETIEGDLPAEVKHIDRGLHAYNTRAADLAAVVNIACLARDSKSKEVIGGALARRWGSCCELQQIWVDERKRKAGLGRQIMHRIESHAKSNGCTLLYLDTFSFQCPDFYQRLGYEVVCEFQGLPNGVSKYIMQKQLRAEPG